MPAAMPIWLKLTLCCAAMRDFQRGFFGMKVSNKLHVLRFEYSLAPPLSFCRRLMSRQSR